MAEKLTRDCWQKIFEKLDDLDVISLVCKDFLSFSRSIQQTLRLKVNHLALGTLSTFLKRFPYLQKICLIKDNNASEKDSNDVHYATLDIALSALDVICPYNNGHLFDSFAHLGSRMKNLKTLRCSVCYIEDNTMRAIGKCFPMLEELVMRRRCRFDVFDFHRILTDGHHGVSDNGVELLTSRLKNLKNVTLFGDLSDKAIIALASNCKLLAEVTFLGPMSISENGIGYLLRRCPNLVSVSLPKMNINLPIPEVRHFTIENSIAYPKGLQEIDFSHVRTHDILLSSIAQAQLPLKKISFIAIDCSQYGLSLLLSTYCRSLTSIGISFAHFLTDVTLGSLLEHLDNLTCISLCNCENLHKSSLINIVKNCPLLESIELNEVRLGKGVSFDSEFVNCRIRRLHLDNTNLDNETLGNIGRLCPDLEDLGLANEAATKRGMTDILKTCRKLRVLSLFNYRDIKMLDEEQEVHELNLEELHIMYSDIDDGGLEMIGKVFPRLRKLELVDCYYVTTFGVMQVIANCRLLKKICLDRCRIKTEDLSGAHYGLISTSY